MNESPFTARLFPEYDLPANLYLEGSKIYGSEHRNIYRYHLELLRRLRKRINNKVQHLRQNKSELNPKTPFAQVFLDVRPSVIQTYYKQFFEVHSIQQSEHHRKTNLNRENLSSYLDSVAALTDDQRFSIHEQLENDRNEIMTSCIAKYVSSEWMQYRASLKAVKTDKEFIKEFVNKLVSLVAKLYLIFETRFKEHVIFDKSVRMNFRFCKQKLIGC